mmetsp:Transcript_54103/g.171651  ORF Transcript_54103/g.171651 Transcript_54103/m.171651 type:complete len:282 (+) Transcript_54103:359-1204(+)
MGKTFCIENMGPGHVSPAQAFCGGPRWEQGTAGSPPFYASCIVQGDPRAMRRAQRICDVPEFLRGRSAVGQHTWVFVAHVGNSAMKGRPEHTDSVLHDGTYHAQLAGRKRWVVRPCVSSAGGGEESKSKPSAKRQRASVGGGAEHIECSTGDLLLINTRVWWHATELPAASTAVSALSVSFARDFNLERVRGEGATAPDPPEQADTSMTNVDGLFATSDVEAGTVILTEDDMPDCALPRSKDPNCEILVGDDGVGAVVAIRKILGGDNFTIAESDSEEEEG